jgi:uncharacterized protein (DUF427 family)
VAESVPNRVQLPSVEPTARRIRVVFGGETIVDTRRAQRVLEGAQPPVYYVPLEDVAEGALVPSAGKQTYCAWKGHASYYDVAAGGERAERAAWTYFEPFDGFEAIRGAVAFYAGPMDACFVDDERVDPQQDRYYGGWITSEIAENSS